MIPVAILGGGVYVARLCELVRDWPGLPPVELRLHARDRDRLAILAAHAAARFVGTEHRARACGELDAALDGAAAIVMLIRVGNLAARDRDERFPTEFGLVGDEGLGAGGMANAWRTIPVLDAIADRIAARAPAASVLNLVAPLGITTRRLVERDLRAVGLCELPAVTRARWSRGVAAEPLAYAGLNHLGFLWSPSQGIAHPAIETAIALGEVTAALVDRLGAAPLHYVIDVFDVASATALGRPRRSGRARALADLASAAIAELARDPAAPATIVTRRQTLWFEHALLPALAAVLGGPAFEAPLDLPNTGQLDEVPGGVVIELDGRLARDGAVLGGVPERPTAVRAQLARFGTAEALVYRAAVRRNRTLLAEAIDVLYEVPRSARAALVDAIVAPVDEEATA